MGDRDPTLGNWNCLDSPYPSRSARHLSPRGGKEFVGIDARPLARYV